MSVDSKQISESAWERPVWELPYIIANWRRDPSAEAQDIADQYEAVMDYRRHLGEDTKPSEAQRLGWQKWLEDQGGRLTPQSA